MKRVVLCLLGGGLTSCALVGDARLDGLLDPDGDGWSVDRDCDNADPTMGGAELWDDAVDNDCDGFAVIDLRNWPAVPGLSPVDAAPEAPCTTQVANTGASALVGTGDVAFALDGTEFPADRIASVPDQDDDGLDEDLWVAGAQIRYATSGGDGFEVPDGGRNVAASLFWGGPESGCPAVLTAGPHPTQGDWSVLELVELCDGETVGTWSFGDPDQRPDLLAALPITPDLWPDLVQVRHDTDPPRVGVVLRQAALGGAGHDAFSAVFTSADAVGDAGFGAAVATGDLDGDNFGELAVTTSDGVWMIPGGALSGTSDTARLADVALLVTLAEVGAAEGSTVLDVAFADLDGDGADELLLAADDGSDTGYRVFAWTWDDSTESLRHSALMVAPEGRCSATVLTEAVFVGGGVPWLLP